MTDRFVPDKPGPHHCRLKRDGLTMLEVKQSIDGGLYARGFNGANYYELKLIDWIAPVPPPDVVDGLVAALEALKASINSQRHDIGATVLINAPWDQVDTALQRYRGG